MTEKNEPQDKVLVIVLGPGRSGTSLLMQALQSLGVEQSENLITKNESNPNGFIEDRDVVDIQKRLLSSVAPKLFFPLKSNWLNTNFGTKAFIDLKKVVEERLSIVKKAWSVKDPRTSVTLPLWQKLCNHLRLVPKYIIAIREPSEMITSYLKQAPGYKQKEVEMICYLRLLYGIYYTTANCLIVDYSSFENDYAETINRISNYIGFQNDFSNIVFEKSLKRSSYNSVRCKHVLLKELYSEAKKFSLGEIHREDLMETAINHINIVENFDVWCDAYIELECNENKIRQRLIAKENELSDLTIEYEKIKRSVRNIKRLNETVDENRLATELSIRINRL